MAVSHSYATTWKEVAKEPSSLEKKVRGLFRGTVLTAASAFPRKFGDNFVRCLYCHHVFDDQRKDFERIIRALKNQGEFINTETLINLADGRQPVDGRYFHISFDDGFKNILTNAAAVLHALNVPSILFVPTRLIGADFETTKKFCSGGYNGIVELCTWEDLKKLQALNFEIGSHTRNHARFSEISRNGKMDEEILGSKEDLETGLGRECKYISWPFGTKNDVDDLSIERTRTVGYQACFGAFRGSVIPKVTSLYRIPRHHFEVHWPLSHILYFASGKMER